MYFTCPRCTQITNLEKTEYDGWGWVLACGCGRVSYEFEQICNEDYEPKDAPKVEKEA